MSWRRTRQGRTEEDLMGNDERFKRNKSVVRPVVERWYSEMAKTDPKFKTTKQPNEVNKVMRASARALFSRGDTTSGD
jgi:hypothetical protein